MIDLQRFEEAELPRVLVVADNPTATASCRAGLEHQGFAVTVAADGDELIRLARSKPRPQVIVIDVMTPGIGGWSCLAELKADPDVGRVPVVMLTGRFQDSNPSSAFAAGLADYVVKPVCPNALAYSVRMVLELRDGYASQVTGVSGS